MVQVVTCRLYFELLTDPKLRIAPETERTYLYGGSHKLIQRINIRVEFHVFGQFINLGTRPMHPRNANSKIKISEH